MLAAKRLLFLIVTFMLLQDNHHFSVVVVEATKHVHIVYMGEKKHDDPKITKEIHHELLSNVLGSKEAARGSMVYSYKHGFSGFAARLTQSEAEEISKFPVVVRVLPSRMHKLHTTRSWDFIGLELHRAKQSLLTDGKMGKGIIIGIIDSGVWPESKSFSDEGMGPVPSRWKGICQRGEHFNASNCNRKLIGARWFVKGSLAGGLGTFSTNKTGEYREFKSARDSFGHGTHTASIAAGNFVENANDYGLAEGLARGGAPRAHLAIYKACWFFQHACSDADILKAFDKAIHDGVDVLSISLGDEIPLFPYADRRDSIAIGSFHAVAQGITVVASAGNDGPISGTVANVAPWLITVGASTTDRRFMAAIMLGNNRTLWGQSLYTGKDHRGFYVVTYSERIAVASAEKGCGEGSLNKTLAAGKIVLCFKTSDEQDMVSASAAVSEAGGIGVIYAQSREDGSNPCVIPCVKVDYGIGTQILTYIRRARFPIAKLGFPSSAFGKLASPRVASFSSRGPSSISPQVLKPDIVAPGVDILAAFPSSDEKGAEYKLLSGTSMSAPHVAGIAALIKSMHSNWSPGAIRSALVTTASQTGTDGNEICDGGPTDKIGDPFDIGGGHVDPNKAMDPGLVYDTTISDYIRFLCSMGYSRESVANLTETKLRCKKDQHHGQNLNLPSIVIPSLRRRLTVTRTVTNVGPEDSVYEAVVKPPYGTSMKVEPQVLRFNSTTQVLTFKVSFASVREKARGGYKFGSLTWTDGEHFVRSPVAVRVLEFGIFPDV
ncbi:subtilisin-like protease SBT3.6 isoform X2 [Punica granatum]|uniref:Subtilisin-like protease SBT3.6 isoform X2 n=1 Tax=Punica granatum TaxID=22663 RepID=A0A6P8E4C8_PUNGR|nr:subtilisin-like protease SBT3.6 isoform X2 [Punica granatum]